MYNRRGFLAIAPGLPFSVAMVRQPPVRSWTEVPWLQQIQTPPADAPTGSLSDLLKSNDGTPIANLPQWNRHCETIRKKWSDYLGLIELPERAPKLKVLEEDRPAGCVRQLVSYESEPGVEIEGYLIRPAKPANKAAGVVVMHSTVKHTIRQPAGVQGRPEKFFGLKLAQRGMFAFCPKCFLWEKDRPYLENVRLFKQRHPESKGMAKMLYDAQRAVDILLSIDGVDRTRIGAVGHSLGAKEAVYLAAFDRRVKVTVSSEGGIGTRFSNWDAPWYLGPEIHDGSFSGDHHELLGLVAPRPFLLLGGNSADGNQSWPYIVQALRAYDLFDGPNRIGLLNHEQGHSVPPRAEQQIYEWLVEYL